MNQPFLNCNIWSVPLLEQPYLHENFYLVHTVYHYNSMESGIVTFKFDCVQIPEYEILNNYKINELDFDLINENAMSSNFLGVIPGLIYLATSAMVAQVSKQLLRINSISSLVL